MAMQLAERETLAIPQAVRDEVDERDAGHCRFCGRWLGPRRALHHIEYGGVGLRRLHAVGNLVSICWLPGDPAPRRTPCHQVAHSAKHLWIPYLLTCTQRTGVTALQLRRWELRALRGVAQPRGD